MNRNLILFIQIVFLFVIAGCNQSENVQRYGSVIGVAEEKLEYYKELHANPWPEINSTLKECNIRNYSIYLRQLPDSKYYLFAYFEYTGEDFDADMKKMAADPMTQKWWKETDPCQIPLPDRKESEWWASMEEVYHLD
jgi:L-rhamnose mutarotase